MMKISHFAVRHPAVIGMLLIALIAFGLYALGGLNVEFMADISLPTVEVLAVYPGAGAEDVEQDVTEVMEENFVTLPDFKSIDSTSSNSFSWITITFQDGVDPYDMLGEIRNRIQQMEDDLPDALEGEPVAIVGSATMLPVMLFSVDAGEDTQRLSSYVKDTLVPRITRIKGVAEVTVTGMESQEVRVTVRTADLTARGISMLQIYQVLQYANLRIPVGDAVWHGTTANLRYDGSMHSLDALRELPIGATEDGTVIRLGHVADISFEKQEMDTYADANQVPRVVVSVTKRNDGNTLSIVKEIKKVLSEAEEETGGATSFQILSDDSKNIIASLMKVSQSGLLGILMAVFVIFLFLSDPRATITIALSIPLSILFTFIGMRIVGVTINLMSLSGIVVALGMVVDGSIVMLEQVMRLHKQHKMPSEEALLRGADLVGSPILASTTTTLAVFIPLSLLSGIVGSILRDVALTLILALIASLLAALVVVPFILRLILRIPEKTRKREPLFSRMLGKLETRYRKGLAWSLTNRKFILLVALLVLVLAAFAGSLLGLTFIPSTDNGDFNIDLTFPQGYSLEQTRERALQAQALVSEQVPEIESIVLFSGQSSGMGFSSPNQANIKVVLVPTKERERTIHEIINEVQYLLSSTIVDATVNTTNGGFDALVGYISGGGGYGLKLVGEDMELLYETAESIKQVLQEDPEVLVASVDTSYDANTLVMNMSHQLMSNLGVNSSEAGLTASLLFQGMEVGNLTQEGGENYPIRLESDLKHHPITSSTLLAAQVPSSTGKLISFASLATLQREQSVSRIVRDDRVKTVTVSATLVSEDTSGVDARIQAYLAQHPLPEGVHAASGGLMELIGDSIEPMVTALIIAVFLVYTVMVIQFERFRQPLIVMVSIPFSLIGVVLGLLLFGSSISLISFMAIIALGGIVVNNGIILIDSINILRENHVSGEEESLEDLRNSVADGGASRLRPILMTTLTTMLGVIPMAFATGEGAAIYAPLGQAIAGGLLSSTMITLFIIPILYYMTERRIILKRQRARRTSHETV
ncbi:MAG: efflux RND transporter permease subunit [Sphaerochaetaceae bacterium]